MRVCECPSASADEKAEQKLDIDMAPPREIGPTHVEPCLTRIERNTQRTLPPETAELLDGRYPKFTSKHKKIRKNGKRKRNHGSSRSSRKSSLTW